MLKYDLKVRLLDFLFSNGQLSSNLHSTLNVHDFDHGSIATAQQHLKNLYRVSCKRNLSSEKQGLKNKTVFKCLKAHHCTELVCTLKSHTHKGRVFVYFLLKSFSRARLQFLQLSWNDLKILTHVLSFKCQNHIR